MPKRVSSPRKRKTRADKAKARRLKKSAPLAVKPTFAMSHVAILQSLGLHDDKTGTDLHRSIQKRLRETESPLRCTLHDITDKDDLLRVLAEYVEQATRRGVRPVLQFEMHGDEHGGLRFADNKWISWEELCIALAPLNMATQFNLVVVLSACDGMGFISGISLSNPSPALVVIGPSDEVRAIEVAQGFEAFYRALLDSKNIAEAMEHLSRYPLQKGKFVFMMTDLWFHELMTGFLSKGSLAESARRVAMQRHLVAKSRGEQSTLREQKKFARDRMRERAHEYFKTFFMTQHLPDNLRQFAQIRQALDRR